MENALGLNKLPTTSSDVDARYEPDMKHFTCILCELEC